MRTVDEREGETGKHRRYSYPDMVKSFAGKKGSDEKGFKLTVQSGDFTDSEIIVLLGQNGTGKVNHNNTHNNNTHNNNLTQHNHRLHSSVCWPV